jgi:hypothetical protein
VSLGCIASRTCQKLERGEVEKSQLRLARAALPGGQPANHHSYFLLIELHDTGAATVVVSDIPGLQ